MVHCNFRVCFLGVDARFIVAGRVVRSADSEVILDAGEKPQVVTFGLSIVPMSDELDAETVPWCPFRADGAPQKDALPGDRRALKPLYRKLAKHSTIYAIGLIIQRIASVAMLPIFTHNLSRADYGCLAILDLLTTICSIILGIAMSEAVSRYHFETEDEDERRVVWWTGLGFVLAFSVIFLTPLWQMREPLAKILLGEEITSERRMTYISFLLPSMFFSMVGMLPNAYLRARHRSKTFVAMSFFHLVFSIGLIFYFLVYRKMGVEGVLMSNLIANGANGVLLILILIKSIGKPEFSFPLLKKLWKFGAPLIATSLLSVVMHEADRYLLRKYRSMDDVGIYSLGYMIAQGVYMLFMMPFLSIWEVVVYQIAPQKDSRQIYSRVFEVMIYALILCMVGLALCVEPILAIVATAEYQPAAAVIPIVSIGYVFFSMNTFFTIPARLAKKTGRLVIAAILGAGVNIGANMILIPKHGPAGAAWATVMTFAVFSFSGLFICRPLERIHFPFTRVVAAGVGGVGAYLLHNYLLEQEVSLLLTYSVAAACWLALAAIMCWPALGYIRSGLLNRLKPGDSKPEEPSEEEETLQEVSS